MSDLIKMSVLTIDDIEAIISLLNKIYRGAYILQWMYDPKALQQAIQSKRYIFAGTKIKDQLIAMLTISFPTSAATVAEVGTLCVSPRYREYHNGEIVRKLLDFSNQLVNDYAKTSDVCVLLIKSVTKHVLTQKLQILSNLLPVGITYCTRPEERVLQKLLTNKNTPAKLYHDLSLKRYDQVITVFCYPSKIQNIKLCLPETLYRLVKQLFTSTSIVIENYKNIIIPIDNKLDVQIEIPRSFVGIHVSHGSNNSTKLLEQIKSFIGDHYRVIHVFLNIGQYNLLETIEALQKSGFIYCGFIPCYYGIDGHALILQFLNGCTSQVDLNMFLDERVKELHKQLTEELKLIHFPSVLFANS